MTGTSTALPCLSAYYKLLLQAYYRLLPLEYRLLQLLHSHYTLSRVPTTTTTTTTTTCNYHKKSYKGDKSKGASNGTSSKKSIFKPKSKKEYKFTPLDSSSSVAQASYASVKENTC
jgi:hypothetical protein